MKNVEVSLVAKKLVNVIYLAQKFSTDSFEFWEII